MIDNKLQLRLSPLLNKLARVLLRWGLRADQLTIAGFAVGILCLPLLAFSYYDYALLCLLINRGFDGLDGAMARVAGAATDRGGFLDITLDFIFYSAFVLGATIANPEHALLGAFLMFSFVANGSAFLAFSIFATKRSFSTDTQQQKSFHYLAGLAEGGETFATFVLLCLFPAAFWIIALVFGVLCCISAAGRIAYACFKLS